MSTTPDTPDKPPRIAVIVPCYGDGELLREAIASVREEEPVEIIIVDDGSDDPATQEVLSGFEADGLRVLHHEENRGPGAARSTALRSTQAEFIFPLDADDLAVAGVLGKMADRLEENPDAAVCFGDYLEFGGSELVRAAPEQIDPYRLAYTNEYPISALFRRRALEEAGAWSPIAAYEDWHLWMSLAEQGKTGVHLGPAVPTYQRRLHGTRLLTRAKLSHSDLYRRLRDDHPKLFAELPRHRRHTSLGRLTKLLYPIVYGGRRRFPWEARVKALLDRLGLWTLRR